MHIVHYVCVFCRAVGEKGKSEFEDELRNLFQSLVLLMQDTKNETLLIQVSPLHLHLSCAFSELWPLPRAHCHRHRHHHRHHHHHRTPQTPPHDHLTILISNLMMTFVVLSFPFFHNRELL